MPPEWLPLSTTVPVRVTRPLLARGEASAVGALIVITHAAAAAIQRIFMGRTMKIGAGLVKRCPASRTRGTQPKLNTTPVRSSDTSHSRAAISGSLATALMPTRFG